MPKSVKELEQYLAKHPLVQCLTDPVDMPVRSAFVRGGVLHFRGSMNYLTFRDATFDDRGFEVSGHWGNRIRYEYRETVW